MYGVQAGFLTANLKGSVDLDGDHSSTGPITITYNKKERKVVFSSKTFEYHQSQLPKKDFSISVC